MDKITNEVLDKIRKVQDFYKKIENGYRIIYVCPSCSAWKEEDGGPMTSGCDCIGERMAFIRTNFIFPELDKMKNNHERLVEAAKGIMLWLKREDMHDEWDGQYEIEKLEKALKAADGE